MKGRPRRFSFGGINRKNLNFGNYPLFSISRDSFWVVPTTEWPTPKLPLFCGKICLALNPWYGKIIDQILKWNFYPPPLPNLRFRLKNAIIFLCSRQQSLLASACWPEKSFRVDGYFVVIPKREDGFIVLCSASLLFTNTMYISPYVSPLFLPACVSMLKHWFKGWREQKWGSGVPVFFLCYVQRILKKWPVP